MYRPLNHEALDLVGKALGSEVEQCSNYLLYQYKITHTDAEAGGGGVE